MAILGYAALRGSYCTFSECWTVSGPLGGSLRHISKRDIVVIHIYNCCGSFSLGQMRLDIKKTIETKFLVENDKPWDRKAEIFLGYLTSILWIGLLLFISYFTWTVQNPPYVLIAIIFPLTIISIYGIIVRDRLFEIRATQDKEANKKLTKELMKTIFKKNAFIDTGDIWTSCRRYKFVDTTNNRVILIFHEDRVLFNAEFFARGQIQSPIHPIMYLFKFLKLKNEIESNSKLVRT